MELVKKEDSSLMEIADLISSDPPLSAEVLKAINSPLYGVPSKVSTVPRAVSLLGIDTVKNLALCFSLIKNPDYSSKGVFDHTAFWKHSLVTAITSKLLAQSLHPDVAENAFFVGLLHNIGILAMVQCMPKQYSLVVQEMAWTQCDFHEAENQILGFDHTEVGEYFTRKWGFPEIFSTPIRYHHHPEKLKSTGKDESEFYIKILHLSSAFNDFFNRPDKTLYLGLIEFYNEKHGFSGKYDIEEILLQIQRQTAEVFPLFEIKVTEEMDYSKIIDDARKELIIVSESFINRFVEQQRQMERLRELAAHDGLTGLINYQKFHEVLETEIARARRYKSSISLVMSDIDYFKQVNDSYGHLAGDYALKEISRFLQDHVRTSDIVARYGGEEFVIILPETSLEGAIGATERIRKKVSEMQMSYEGKKLSVTLSFGIACLRPDKNISKSDLIRSADDALLEAKRSGRNKLCVSN
ncbi:MAG: GGDEF domain-containing protein [Deltaproteobacteria bacterium]|nr:GGDEF domain-containing protein [Deltaproteobacteria bacterium]